MDKENYIEIREKKVSHYIDIMSRTKGVAKEQLKYMKWGFLKGMDTATKGGEFVYGESENLREI